MFWLHCNRCGYQYTQDGGKKSLSLTNCGHIFCYECARASRDKCAVCVATPIRYVPINSEMKPDVAVMFQPPSETIKTAFKASQFQMNHSHLLAAAQRKNLGRIGEQYKKVCARLEESRKELDEVRQERDRLAREKEELQHRRHHLQGQGHARPSSVFAPQPSASRAGFPFGQQRSVSPTFSDMPVNAFPAKTPAALKSHRPTSRGGGGSHVPALVEKAKNNLNRPDFLSNFPF